MTIPHNADCNLIEIEYGGCLTFRAHARFVPIDVHFIPLIQTGAA